MQAPNIPASHAVLLDRALLRLKADPRIVGVAGAGSLARGTMDEFSDLDLLIATEPDQTAAVTADRRSIAAAVGPLLAAFTGEHVGEPRLLICLYDREENHPPIHVDLKFVSLPDAANRVDEVLVLWERDGRLSQVLQTAAARFPPPDLGWIEDRFWVWMHYAALKVGRGELFEVLDFLAFLRAQVLGPLALLEAGGPPMGVRRIETAAPVRAAQLQATVAEYNRASCIGCIYAAVDLYRSLRSALNPGRRHAASAVENAAMTYLAEIQERRVAEG